MTSSKKDSNIIPSNLTFDMIPNTELNLFEPYIKKFKKGDTLIYEGDDDKTLYLLRIGTVGVYRNIDGNETLLTFIGAVNFIGEMEFYTESKRISTVRVYSDEVVVYSFINPDISTMLCNREWGEKLLIRLSSDLKLFSDKTIELESEIKLLRQKIAKSNNI